MVMSLFWLLVPFFGKHLNAERQAEKSIESRVSPSVQELQIWRRQRPLDKLHNIIVYIMANVQ